MLFVLALIFFALGVALWMLDAAGRRSRRRGADTSKQAQQRGNYSDSTGSSEDAPANTGEGQSALEQPDRAVLQYSQDDPRDVIDAEVEEELSDLEEIQEQQAQGSPVGYTDDVVEVSTARPKPTPRTQQSISEQSEDDFHGAGSQGLESTDAVAGDGATKSAGSNRVRPQVSARKHAFPNLPGASKREKKAWAAAHGWEYAKQDAYLAEEWTRGAAASGAVAKDVVSGVAQGYEMHLLELGGATVMAMRHAAGSEVVIDAQKVFSNTAEGQKTAALSEDLVPVERIAEFELSATDQGVGRRFADQRVRAGIAGLPAQVKTVWWEHDWVLAQLEKGSDQEVWNATLAPLAELAGAARALPPRKGSQQPVDFHEFDPTRPLVHTPSASPEQDDDGLPDLPTPPVEVAEPVALPRRATVQVLGEVESHEIGEDSVRVIGSGDSKPTDDFQGTRVLRDTSAGSSIFDDIVAELGDPTVGAVSPHDLHGNSEATNSKATRAETTELDHGEKDEEA